MMDPLHLLTESVQDGIKWTTYQLLSPYPSKAGDDRLHLEKTMDWLVNAIRNGKGGVASHYSLLSGKWLSPFPETTGYIIPTLFDYARLSGDHTFARLAVDLTDWLSEVQGEDGGCMQGKYEETKGKTPPVVFNTGQNLLGFIRAFRETGKDRYLACARKAGDFLVASTDESGIWDKNLLRGFQHTINTRCSWALLQLEQLCPGKRYAWVAEQNLKWARTQQTESGWFNHGSSKINVLPSTHFIAYTCRGFLESYRITGNRPYLEAAKRTADPLLSIFQERKTLHAFWDRDWKNRGKHLHWMKGRFICLTGNIQMSLVWMKLYEEYGDDHYRDGAFQMIDQMKALHTLSSYKRAAVGGVKGSFPIFGGYSTFKYPNWAAKFFADALMLKVRLQEHS